MTLLNTCYHIFLHGSEKVNSMQKPGVNMPAFVDCVESRLELSDESLGRVLIRFIAQLAVDVSGKIVWKHLS